MTWVVRSLALVVAGFGVLAIIGFIQAWLRPLGVQTWLIVALCLVAVSCGALALAIWKMSRD
jgi:hypothetical protein